MSCWVGFNEKKSDVISLHLCREKNLKHEHILYREKNIKHAISMFQYGGK